MLNLRSLYDQLMRQAEALSEGNLCRKFSFSSGLCCVCYEVLKTQTLLAVIDDLWVIRLLQVARFEGFSIVILIDIY